MATVDQVARDALAAIDTDAGFLRAVQWASSRLRELTNRSRFRAYRQVGEVQIPAKITTGTATTTRDSNIVTGSATAAAAWDGADLVGRFFRTNRVWYKIEGVVGSGTSTSLRLQSPFSEDAVSAGSYDIVQRYTRVHPDARHLGKFVWMRFGQELETATLTELNILYPERLLVTAGGPAFVAEVGTGDDGVRLVEIYPYPAESELIHYVYWPHSPDLQPGDNLPEAIDPYVLREGILIDLYRYEAMRALRRGGQGAGEAAAILGNWAARQVQRWEQAIRDAGKADKGTSDVTLILRHGPSHRQQFYNNTARSEVYIRGNRP